MNSTLIKQQIANTLGVETEDVEIVEDPTGDEYGFAVVSGKDEYVFDCYKTSENRDGGLRDGSLKKW